MAAISRSRIGDKVSMCLAARPEDGPKGDDCGKVYTTIDLGTGKVRSLSESQSMCGGA